MPDNASITDAQMLIITNGIDPVSRWDGLTTTLETAGIAAPPTAPVINAAGGGTITGEYFAYVVFVDRYDNISNPSPLSAGVTVTNVGEIIYTNVPIPTDPKVVQRQIWRNTAGQTLTFYQDVLTNDITSTTFTSTQSDNQLSREVSQVQFDQNGNTLTFLYGVPPDWKPFNVQHLGRMYLSGEIVYTEGCVEVVTGSAVVKGIGTRWPANFAGRFLYVNNGLAGVEIQSVNPATQQIVLTTTWTGASDNFLNYWIRPAPAEKNLLYYSGPGTPEAFPGPNAVSLPEDGFEHTGLMSMTSFLYVLKQRRIYRFTVQADPAQDGFLFLAANRGCINQRCAIVIGDTAYLLDEQGIYSFDGGDVKDLSKPIQSIFRGNNRFYKVNWSPLRFWHGCFDENYEILRWFITLNGDYLPRHALCYNYDFNRWWIEEYPMPIGASAIGKTPPAPGTWRMGGQDVLYYGSRAKKVYAIGYGQILDGPDPAAGTTRGPVSSAGQCSLTCNVAMFAATGLIGSNVYIVAGTGEGQSRRITALSGQTLQIGQPWLILPDTTSVFQIGGVPWEWRSGRLQFADNEERNTRKLVFGWRPLTPDSPQSPEAVIQFYQDYSTSAVVNNFSWTKGQRRGVSAQKGSTEQRVDLTRTQGVADINFDAQRERNTDAPRRVTVDITGVGNDEQMTVKSVEMQGAVTASGGSGG